MSKKISRANQARLNAAMLREHLHYCSERGVFTWKPRRWRSAKGVAGSKHPHGYIVITIDDIQYAAHRLAWLYHYGEWPKLEIDHRNGKRDDNRIANLREATQVQNNANMRLPSRNKSGFKGVRRKWSRWEASLNAGGKYYYLGTFDTAEEASQAYLKKSHELFGQFARAA